MRKILTFLLAFVAVTAFAYTPRGQLRLAECDDQNIHITVNPTCQIGSHCWITWDSQHDPSFSATFVYMFEANSEPLGPAGVNALPITSCTENGGPQGLPGYNCLRMKMTGYLGSSWYETTPDNENLFFYGSRYTGDALSYGPVGTLWYDVLQSPTKYMTAEVHFACTSGGVVMGFHKDFLIHVVDPSPQGVAP